MSEEAAAAEATGSSCSSSAPTAEAVSEAPTAKMRRRSSVLSDFRNKIRSRLSSRGFGDRFKSLVKWRSFRGSKASTTVNSDSSLCEAPPNSPETGDEPLRSALSSNEAAGTNPANERDASGIESQEIKSNVPHNLIESNLVSSSSDPGTSAFSTDSEPYFNTGASLNEDRVVITTTFVESTNLTADDLSNLTATNNERIETNPINDQDSLGVPSAVVGVQIQAALGLGARILDVGVPILYIQNNSVSSAATPTTTMTTEESLASNSSESSSGFSGGTSSSSSAVIEILASTLDDAGRRYDHDYARPYYDLTVRPRIRKQVRRFDEDPPIY